MNDPKQMARFQEQVVDVVFNDPALFANDCFVTRSGGTIRLTFVERFNQNKPPRFRAAVVMNLEDCGSMANVITKFATASLEDLQRAMANPQQAPGPFQQGKQQIFPGVRK